jgi:hypothetical protein
MKELCFGALSCEQSLHLSSIPIPLHKLNESSFKDHPLAYTHLFGEIPYKLIKIATHGHRFGNGITTVEIIVRDLLGIRGLLLLITLFDRILLTIGGRQRQSIAPA